MYVAFHMDGPFHIINKYLHIIYNYIINIIHYERHENTINHSFPIPSWLDIGNAECPNQSRAWAPKRSHGSTKSAALGRKAIALWTLRHYPNTIDMHHIHTIKYYSVIVFIDLYHCNMSNVANMGIIWYVYLLWTMPFWLLDIGLHQDQVASTRLIGMPTKPSHHLTNRPSTWKSRTMGLGLEETYNPKITF